MSLLRTIVLAAAVSLLGGNDLFATSGAPAKGEAATPAKLTAEKLPDFLKKLGYAAEVVATEIGSSYCLVRLSRDGWSFEIEVMVNPSGAIWLTAPLVEVSREKAGAGALLNLLEANGTIGPCFFTYRAADGQLCMKLEVVGGSETGFQADLSLLTDKIRQTHSLWREETWK